MIMYISATYMQKKQLHILLSKRRINKLRLLAVEKDKTMTQIIQ
jgi:hypothetical protein